MVVDMLRPGKVPISPDTKLWFEFILDQKLLVEHLRQPNPEPSAIDLIAEFLSADTSNGFQEGLPNSRCLLDSDAIYTQPSYSDGQPVTRKQLALKILVLKIAAFLNWNLAKLTPGIQQQLLQDLVFMASDGAFSIPPQDISINMIKKPHMQFALTFYHRWVLRFPEKNNLEKKFPFIHNLPNITLENAYNDMNSKSDEILRINKSSRMQSIKYLKNVIAYYCEESTTQIKIPVMESFVHLTEDMVIAHNWDAGSYVSLYELLMQIHFDLCCNFFFYGQHEEARIHIMACRKNQKLLEYEVKSKSYSCGHYDKVPWGKLNHASMSEDDILGYIRALNFGQELLDEDKTLLQRLQESVANNYVDIIGVLQEDNLSREIPMIHRQVAESDIQTAASNGAVLLPKDLLIRVSALNAVRYALDGGLPSTHLDFLNKFKTVGAKFLDLLFWALAPVLMSNLSEDDWLKLKLFFLHLATSHQCKLAIDKIDEYLKKQLGESALEIRRKLICDEHLETIIKDQINSDGENMDIPRELLLDTWDSDLGYKAVPELDMGRLKKRLVEASSAEDVRTCLMKLATMSSYLPLWKLSPYCKPIGDLEGSLELLPQGFLQDFCVLVSGAARVKLEAGDARAALALLTVGESEARNQLAGGNDPALSRLCRALAWEVLLLQVNLMLAEWPHHRLNVTLLAKKCKAAIAAADNDVDAPRSQVVLAAWLGLLNMCAWEPGAGVHTGSDAGAGLSANNMAAALCAACDVLQHGKAAHKFPRTLWDHVLKTFNNSIRPKNRKRTTHHHLSNYANHHDQFQTPYQTVAQGLREPLAISILLSNLAKIYNILVDDSMELAVEYTNLWPNNIGNMNNYNPKDILEALRELLERSLKFYPYNTSWLRLYGDTELAAGRHAAALRHYLCALAVGSQHFTTSASDEDGLARRAARCCQALASPTQAAALCQLTTEPDYTRAFKCITEKIANVGDSTDAYYRCLWDSSLLELTIATHARRGEAARRARAVTAIGALELNASNSEDIRREAAAVRRARLLRALTDQYSVLSWHGSAAADDRLEGIFRFCSEEGFGRDQKDLAIKAELNAIYKA